MVSASYGSFAPVACRGSLRRSVGAGEKAPSEKRRLLVASDAF